MVTKIVKKKKKNHFLCLRAAAGAGWQPGKRAGGIAAGSCGTGARGGKQAARQSRGRLAAGTPIPAGSFI